jgi:hypothetical protein
MNLNPRPASKPFRNPAQMLEKRHLAHVTCHIFARWLGKTPQA